MSQGGYPIKGLDILLKAAGLLIREYPDLEIRIAGYSVLAENNLKNKLKRRNYELYYLQLIKELGLNNKVHFLGALSEMDMVREYCNANVFVLPSIIENSPNSMGEAMLIGTPCVISYCGGIPQLFEHNKDGFLFQPGAYYMLAYYVKLIFDSDDITTKFSKHARMHARTTHNLHFNTNNLLHIYSDLIKI